MNAQDLRNSILQLAVQGQLVEQRPEEGTARELLKQISAEKEKLIKEKKIKKEQPLPEIAEDEIPFEIPVSWEWVRLNAFCVLDDGENVSNVDLPYLEAAYLRGKKAAVYKKSGKSVLKGQYAILVDGENSGEVFRICENGILGSTFKVLRITSCMDDEYVIRLLELYKSVFKNNKKGAAIPHLDKELFFNLVVGLPPLEEQKRIVAKIEEILPYIEQYDKAHTKLEIFNEKFPEDMKKSILQLAMQGKLVEQRPEEGTADELYGQIAAEKARLIKEGKIKAEKPLTEIGEDEIPFEIPKSWKWVRLGKIGTLTRGSGIKRTETLEDGYPCIRYGELYTTYKTKFSNTVSFVAKELYDKSKKIVKDDVVMTLTGENKTDIAMAVAYEGETPIAMGGDMTCWSHHMMEPLYLVYLINSPYAISCKRKLATGDIIIHISNDKLVNIPIPVPPIAEQKRIVAQIEEILPYCERLMK